MLLTDIINKIKYCKSADRIGPDTPSLIGSYILRKACFDYVKKSLKNFRALQQCALDHM